MPNNSEFATARLKLDLQKVSKNPDWMYVKYLIVAELNLLLGSLATVKQKD